MTDDFDERLKQAFKPNAPKGFSVMDKVLGSLAAFAVVVVLAVLVSSTGGSSGGGGSYCEKAWETNKVQASRGRPGTEAQIKRAYIRTCEQKPVWP